MPVVGLVVVKYGVVGVRDRAVVVLGQIQEDVEVNTEVRVVVLVAVVVVVTCVG
jgi:hypothetical protein